MIADTISSVLIYALIVFGLAWPLARRLATAGAEIILAGVCLSLLGVFIFAWCVYVWELPHKMFWILPVASALSLALSTKSLAQALRDPDVRNLLVAQALVTTWCMAWLGLVISYSGGTWVADWFGHWQRTLFFLERGPVDIMFNGFDPLTSRPPLANIVVGVFVALKGNDFAHYQLATTFLGSLTFLPAALLVRQFGSSLHSVGVLALFCMLNPMFVQNATYAWTKLSATFFTLGAIYYFLRAREASADGSSLFLCAAALAAALLTHYSAGPYAIVLAATWILHGGNSRWRDPAWWRATAVAFVIGAVLLSSWFGWAFTTYGVRGTLLTNTTVTDQVSGLLAKLAVIGSNVRDTIVPHFLRQMDYGVFAQRSPWGWWRDWFFQLYQLNLLIACGSAGWLVSVLQLRKVAKHASRETSLAWIAAVTVTIVLGVAVVPGRDSWGLAHICLQPLILLGLIFLASRWDGMSSRWKTFLLVGAVIDLLLGIVLQFGVQSFLIDEWFTSAQTAAETITSYSRSTVINFRGKLHGHWIFLGDGYSRASYSLLGVLLLLLILAVLQLRNKRVSAS